MNIDIITIFPEMFQSPFSSSIIKRAQDQQKVNIKLHNLRDWATDKYQSVDDRPYGGGAGMLMRVDIIDRAVNDLRQKDSRVILIDTKGEFYNQHIAQKLSRSQHLIFIVPHYEGVDYRVQQFIADQTISIGPYVLTGGELPTMVVIDSVVRLIPEVINQESLKEESYADDLQTREYPQYTRPEIYKKWKVPEILTSGNHPEINKWRQNQMKKSK